MTRIAPIPIALHSLAASSSPEASEPSTPSARYPKRKRAEVQYYPSEDDWDATDSDTDIIPVPRKRIQSTRPLPPRKIFPFLSLPAELRNKIYAECLPRPTKLAPSLSAHTASPETPRFYFSAKQRSYRRSIELIPSLTEDELEGLSYTDYHRRFRRRLGLGRRHQAPQAPPPANPNSDADSDSENDSESTTTGPATTVLNLLAVCKTIYAEAAPLFYTNSTFVFTAPDALFAFAARLSPITAKLLRHIEILSWTSTRTRKNRGYAAMAMLAARGVTNLSSLYLNCSMGYFYSYSWRGGREQMVPKRVARKVYRECYDWLEVVGGAKADVSKSVEVLRLSEENFGSWVGGTQAGDGTKEEQLERGKKMYKTELLRLVCGGR